MSNKKTKIAIISNLTKGGAVRYLNDLNDVLSTKYDLHHFQPVSKPKRGNNKFLNLIRYLYYLYIKLPGEYRDIVKQIRKNKIKLAIIHHDSYLKSPPVFGNSFLKTIYILHEPPREFYENTMLHSSKPSDVFLNLLRLPIKYIDLANVKKADVIISNSNYSREIIMKIYKRESQMIYPGVNKFFIGSVVARNTKNNVISVGSLLKYKGHDQTIALLGKINSSVRPTFIIVGDGPLEAKKNIEKLLNKYSVKAKIFKDVTDQMLKKLYSESKVFVNLSYHEPFGISALEGLVSGCFLLTCDKCGTSELAKFFPNQVAVVTSLVDAGGKLVNFLNNKNDLRANKIVTPEIFSWENVAARFTTIIKSLI